MKGEARFLTVLLLGMVIFTMPPAGPDAILPDHVVTQTHPPKATLPSRSMDGCGIRVEGGYSTRFWAAGPQAARLCEQVESLLEEEDYTVARWDGRGTAYHFPVCSDELPTFTYEVIGTVAEFPSALLCHYLWEEVGLSAQVREIDHWPDYFDFDTGQREGGWCAFGLSDHDARIVIEGEEAQDACEQFVVWAISAGKYLFEWENWVEGWYTFHVVCADSLPSLSYQVIDSGSAFYGDSFCNFMRGQYGISHDVIRHPDRLTTDIFNIGAYQEAVYHQSCKEHGGEIDPDWGDCIVYYGDKSYYVTIDWYGRWNAEEAAWNRSRCEVPPEEESWWAVPPQYHADTGVCEEGIWE